jgi:hypothetical protein
LTKISIPPLKLHPAQQVIAQSAARFKVIDCGRRFGKTLSSLEWLLFDAGGGAAIDGKPVAFFAPTYQLMLDVWKDAERTLRPVTRKANKTENRIELINGGVVDFWTLQDDSAGRGRKYTRVVIDEAAHARYLKDAWQKAIVPTLTDYQGHARVISTPNGRNFFWELFQHGKPDNPKRMPDWESFTFPTSANPHILPSEIEGMRQMLPERVFAQEYLAQFLEDGGGVFRRVSDAIDASLEQGIGGKAKDSGSGDAYIIGADWGRHKDFTVFSVLRVCKSTGHCSLVEVDRFTDIDYSVQMGRLRALHQRFARAPILAESNSMGAPLVEQLQRSGLPVRPFATTNASKAQAIEALALAFEQGTIKLPPVGWLIDELMAFDQERTPSGATRYCAPNGGHDDGVMSLAIAYSGVKRGDSKPMFINAAGL